MTSENGTKQLSSGSYQQLDSMINSLEVGDLQNFAFVKHLVTYLGGEGFDLNDYPRRLNEFENNLVRKSKQGDIGASTILLEMANQLEQRMDGVYSEDIRKYREVARRS